jgi:hypothetical protein
VTSGPQSLYRPRPRVKALRTPAGSYRPFRLARPSIPTKLGWTRDLPLTGLPVYNPQTVFTCFRSSRNVFGPLCYIDRSYVRRILNCTTISYYTYSSVTPTLQQLRVLVDIHRGFLRTTPMPCRQQNVTVSTVMVDVLKSLQCVRNPEKDARESTCPKSHATVRVVSAKIRL